MLQTRLLIVTLFVSQSEAANHYCIQDSMKVFSMNADSDQTETLLTSHGDMELHVPRQRCLWDVKIHRMTEPLQLVLSLRRGRLWQEAANGTGCPSELSVALQGSGFHREWRDGSSLPKAPIIVPVYESSQQLIVRFSTGDLQPEAVCGRIELTIGVAKKGYCGRNMLLHRHRCHFISDEKLELSDLTGTGAELASISGIEQLRDLLSDNEQRNLEYPYKEPLDLSNIPLRVGVFECTSSGILEFGNFGSGSCMMLPFNSTGFYLAKSTKSVEASIKAPSFKRQCGVLRLAQSGKRLLELGHCGIKVRSLLCFSEVPVILDNSNGVSCGICSVLSNEVTTDGKAAKIILSIVITLTLVILFVFWRSGRKEVTPKYRV